MKKKIEKAGVVDVDDVLEFVLKYYEQEKIKRNSYFPVDTDSGTEEDSLSDTLSTVFELGSNDFFIDEDYGT